MLGIRRRQFITLLGSAAAWPVTARAQQRMQVVGFLTLWSPGDTPPRTREFAQGLKEAGFVEGQNVVFESRFASGKVDQLPALAAELVRRRVDAFYVAGPPATIAAKAATATIPIVFGMGEETAWAAKTRLALANILSPGNNEAAGALELIEMLQLKGCVVTMDALHCRRDTAQAIVERGGDYVLAVKDNQPGLLRDAKAAIAKAEHNGSKQATTTDADHDRKETRTAMVAPAKDLAEKHDFPGLAGVARVKSKRGRDKQIERYFLLTRCYKPAELLGIVRQHWGIENTLHWTLDVVLDEDLARSRKDNAPANLAVLRRLALNIARAHPNSKASMRAKLKRAGWDEKFLLEMLTNMR